MLRGPHGALWRCALGKLRLYTSRWPAKQGAGSRVMSRLEFHRIRGVVNGMRFGPRLDVEISSAVGVGGLAVRRSGDRGILFVLIYPPALILVFIALIFAAAIAATLIVGWSSAPFGRRHRTEAPPAGDCSRQPAMQCRGKPPQLKRRPTGRAKR